jgi:hypothetical protein
VGALYKFLSQNTQESFAVSLAIDAWFIGVWRVYVVGEG